MIQNDKVRSGEHILGSESAIGSKMPANGCASQNASASNARPTGGEVFTNVPEKRRMPGVRHRLVITHERFIGLL